VQKKHLSIIDKTKVVVVEDKTITENLKKFIEDTMYRQRSAPGEIPIDFAPIYMLPEEKYKYLEKII
jgi:hypothetical protein